MTQRLLYISYASIEAEFALQLAADLRCAGVQAWLDRLQLPSSIDWQKRSDQALERAAGLLVVLSPEWASAAYAQRELAFALEHGLPIFVVSVRIMAEGDYPEAIDTRSAVDFTEWRSEVIYRQRFRRLILRLREADPDWVGTRPSDQISYLIQLVARMESSQGTLEYMTMSDDSLHPSSREARRSAPRLARCWGMTGRIVTLDKVRHAPTAEPRWRRAYAHDIKAALARRPRALLLSEPGGGKTATLHRLTLDAARAHLADPSLPLPLYINLAHWQEGQDFETFVASRAPMLPDVIRRAADGRIVLYIDGLNEITQDIEARIHQIRVWLSSEQAPQRVLFACRTRSYDESLHLDLPMLEIEPLADSTVAEIIGALVGEDHAEAAFQRIFTPESTHPYDAQTRELARNPLLLTGMVFQYKGLPDGDLPTTLGGLLKRWMAALWIRKRVAAMPAWMPYPAVEKSLARLALAIIEQNRATGMPYGDALQYVLDDKMLRAAQNAGLIEIEADVVAFRQPLLAEYFAAVGAARYPLHDRLQPPHFNRWGERVASRWDGVFTILAGLMPNADEIIHEIIPVDPFLAAQILASGVEASTETHTRVLQLLVEITHFVTGEGRLAAVRALTDMRYTDTLYALLDVMRSGSWQVRQAANWLLHRLPLPVPPILFEAVRDWNWSMDEQVAVALRQIGVEALPLLLEVLRDEHWSRRRGAAWALGEIGDPAAAPGLVEALADEEDLVRCEAARALRLIHDVDSLPMLIDALRDRDGNVRRTARETVIAFGAAALPGLLALTQDDLIPARRAAIEALGEIANAEAVPHLLPLIADTPIEVRTAAIQALGRIGSDEAVPSLAAALADMTPLPAKYQSADQRSIADVAAQALHMIDSDDARAALEQRPPGEESMAGDNRTRRGSVLDAIQRLPGRSQAEPRSARPALTSDRALLEALHSPDWEMRKAAVDGLRQAAPAVRVPALLGALRDEDNHVRYAAVQALADSHGEAVMLELIGMLQDPDPLVADAAIDVVARFGAPAVEELIAMLSDADADIRGRSVETLAKIGDPDAVPHLIPLLNDTASPRMERERICDKAAAALEIIGGDAAQRALVAWRGIAKDTPTEPERPSPYAIFDDMIDENGDLLLPYDDLDDTQPRASAADHDDWPLVDDALTEEPFARALTNQQLAQMIEALHNGDWRERQEAAKELRSHVLHVRHLADEAFARHLIAALDDSDQTVRWTATEALAWVAHPSVPHALARMLQDKSWSVRLAALRSLYEHNDASVIEHVAHAARDQQALVREAAVVVLGKLGRAEAVPALTTCLRDAEGFVRRAAAEALGSLRASSAVPALIEALEDVEHQVRYAAVEALGRIGDPAAVRSIARLLRDTATPLWTEGRSLSQATLDALAKIGSPDAKKVIEFWRSRAAKSS